MKPSVVLAFKSKVGASLYGHLKVPILNSFPSFLASVWPDSWIWLPVAQRWPWWNGLWEASWAAERLLKPPGPSRHSVHSLCGKVSALIPLGYYTLPAAIVKNRSVQCLVTAYFLMDAVFPSFLTWWKGGTASSLGTLIIWWIVRDLSSWSRYFPKAVHPNTMWGLEGDTSVQGIAVSLWTSPCWT